MVGSGRATETLLSHSCLMVQEMFPRAPSSQQFSAVGRAQCTGHILGSCVPQNNGKLRSCPAFTPYRLHLAGDVLYSKTLRNCPAVRDGILFLRKTGGGRQVKPHHVIYFREREPTGTRRIQLDLLTLSLCNTRVSRACRSMQTTAGQTTPGLAGVGSCHPYVT